MNYLKISMFGTMLCLVGLGFSDTASGQITTSPALSGGMSFTVQSGGAPGYAGSGGSAGKHSGNSAERPRIPNSRGDLSTAVEVFESGSGSKVSAPYRNPEFCDARAAALARLIPGDAPAFRGQRKPPQSVQQVRSTAAGDAPISIERPAQFPVNGLIQLLQAPFLQGKSWPEACAVAKDFALIALNWLLLGALLVPLRKVFPQVTVFGYYSGAPGSLLGIALLNAALIALLGSIEGLYNERACEIGNPGLQPRVLGKSVLWATAPLGLAYRLQGLTWATIALFGSVDQGG